MNLRNKLNFSGGPGALPESVLGQIQECILEVPGVGLSILGISHRTEWFASVLAELEDNLRALLALPEDYHVLFLQGGATQQFSMVPMTFLRGSSHPADYLKTGYWSAKAVEAARREGPVRVVWDGSECGFCRLPGEKEISFSPEAPYLHYVSNETVDGIQFHRVPGLEEVPRVCDMSSDFLSKPCDVKRLSLIYAHAQKNIGPAGVTIVMIRKGMLREDSGQLPGFLDYHTQIRSRSNYNTPPVFAIYVVLLVTRWLMNEIGGLAHMEQINRRKAGLLYDVLDRSGGFFQGRAHPEDRSLMNVFFNLPTREMEQRFLTQADAAGFAGLAGHRAVGGIRASLYNGLEIAAVEKLVDFMESFHRGQAKSGSIKS